MLLGSGKVTAIYLLMQALEQVFTLDTPYSYMISHQILTILLAKYLSLFVYFSMSPPLTTTFFYLATCHLIGLLALGMPLSLPNFSLIIDFPCCQL